MNNKILILGKGYIGQRLRDELGGELSDKRILTLQDALDVVEQYKPKVLINCIGYTGARNVDDCELDLDKTIMSNTFVPILLAEACIRKNVKFVHISSGCIYHYDYDKPKAITEDMIPDYFGLYYSRVKIYSERALEVLCKEHNILIVRVRIPLDNRSHPKNILNKLIQYKKVIDIPNSITYIPDFVKALDYLIKKNKRGLYNVVNKGGLKYPHFMKLYKKYVPDFEFEVLPYKNLKVKRTNLILSTKKLEKAGFKVRKINDVLEESIKGFLKNGK